MKKPPNAYWTWVKAQYKAGNITTKELLLRYKYDKLPLYEVDAIVAAAA